MNEPTDRQCTLCAAMQPSVNRSGSESSAVVVYVDDVLIALRDPCQAGFMFAPRSHAGVLSIEPSQTAAFLAAMRKVMLAMQSSPAFTRTRTCRFLATESHHDYRGRSHQLFSG